MELVQGPVSRVCDVDCRTGCLREGGEGSAHLGRSGGAYQKTGINEFLSGQAHGEESVYLRELGGAYQNISISKFPSGQAHGPPKGARGG